MSGSAIVSVSEDEQQYARFPLPRLLNRRARARISPDSLLQQNSRRLLCTSNIHAWFSAATWREGSCSLVFSPLSDLREALLSDSEAQVNPQRSQVLGSTLPTSVSLASLDSVLLVAFQGGSIQFFECSALFSPGTDVISPNRELQSLLPLKDVFPCPSARDDLRDIVAILRTDGALELVDIKTGASNSYAAGVSSVSWSEDGGVLAFGYQDGRISVEPFDPTAYQTSRTVLPSAHPEQWPVVSLKWLSDQTLHVVCHKDDSDPYHAIVSVNMQTQNIDTAIINAPFPDRPLQGSFTVVLRNWTGPSATGSNTVLVFGDLCSDALEIVCDIDNVWSQRSAENPLQLPFGGDDDNVLLALEVDLTSQEGLRFEITGEGKDFPPSPILLAYLTDGTVQGWHLAHVDPYPGMSTSVSASTATPGVANSPLHAFSQPSDNPVAPTTPVMQPLSNPSSNFVASTTPTTSPFSSHDISSQSTPMGTALGNQVPPSLFGSKPVVPAFGQPSFGQPAFGQPSFGKPAFGQPSGLDSQRQSTSNLPPAGGGFAAFASTPTKFGQTGFGAFAASTPATFGSSGFGFGATANEAKSTPVSAAQTGFGPYASTPTKFGSADSVFGPPKEPEIKPMPEAPLLAMSTSQMSISEPALDDLSMSDTPGSSPIKTSSSTPFGIFGQQTSMPLSLNHPENTPLPSTSFSATTIKPTSAFGAFASSTQPENSPFKPASGFGAFGGGSGGSAFGGAFSPKSAGVAENPPASFGAFTGPQTPVKSAFSAQSTTPTSAPVFGQSTFGASSFGKSGFGQSSFGKSAFGQPSFGQPSFSQPSPAGAVKSTNTETPPSGGFSAFTDTTSFASLAKGEKPPASSGGFGAFSGTPTTFGTSSKGMEKEKEANTVLTSPGSKASLPIPQSSQSVFSTPKTALSARENDEIGSDEENEQAAESKPTLILSPPSSPDAQCSPVLQSAFQSAFKTSSPSPSAGAFSNLHVSSTGFNKLVPGFGAIGSAAKSDLSPFGIPSSTETSSIFGYPSPSRFENTSTTITAPLFGSLSPSPSGKSQQSSEGPPKSVFASLPPLPSQEPSTTQSRDHLESLPSTASSETEENDENEENEVEGSEQEYSDDEDDDRSLVSDDFSYVSDELPDEEGLSTVREEDEEDEAEEISVPASPQEPTAIPLPASRSPSVQPNEAAVSTSEPAAVPLPLSRSPSIQSEQGTKARSPSPPVKPEPEDVPLPRSRSPSTVPEASISSLRSTPSVENLDSQEKLTTPPETSIKLLPVPPKPTVPSPTSPFGLGMGRPSTRPARSSPLANAPLSGSGDDSDEETSSPIPLKKSPRTVGATSPAAESAEGPPAKRPKTPPPLAAFTAPKPAPSAAMPMFDGFSASKSPTLPVEAANNGFKAPAAPETPSKDEVSVSFIKETTAPLSTANCLGLLTPSTLNEPSPAAAAAKPSFSLRSSPAPSTFGDSSRLSQNPSQSPFSFPAKPAQPTLPFSFGPSAKPVQTSPSLATSPLTFGSTSTPTPSSPSVSTATSSLPFKFPSTSASSSSPLNTNQISPLSSTAPSPAHFASFQKQSNQLTTPSTTSQAPLEPGLQAECAFLVNTLTKELEGLRSLAQDANKKSLQLSNREQAVQFRRDITQLDQALNGLKAQKKSYFRSLEQLESGLLKATTRREEVSRFAEAKTEGDFARMLTARELSPDHLEAQTQLRRNIRAVRDRIEKLEAHLVASKARLNRAKTAKAGLKAPSLDTIYRTCRNIDTAIDHQAKDVTALTAKVSALKIKGPSLKATRDARLPDVIARRPFNVTPHVALTTAAALNAERSAQKVKHALLANRREPLLNRSAASAPTPPVSFQTPQKPKISGSPQTPDFSDMTLNDFGEDHFQVSTPPSSRRGATHAKKHKIIPLKRSPGAPQAPPSAASFDWGPLPSFVSASKESRLGFTR